MALYVIGGSPCSGKSTAAEALCARFGLAYFKVDDHLTRYMSMAVAEGKPACAAVAGMSPEEIWMRDPQVQCDEEMRIYREIFPYVVSDVLACGDRVMTEGAAYLPELVGRWGIPPMRYIAVTPEKAFQVARYRLRPWIGQVLSGCSDREQAFANWMDRDALFAEAVRSQCAALGYASLVNDGGESPECLIRRIAAHFGLTDNPS